ncbi:hypothetical protein Gotur_013626, partial [Gossypium turneri]
MPYYEPITLRFYYANLTDFYSEPKPQFCRVGKSIEDRKTEARIFFSRKDQKIGSSDGERSGSRYGDQRLGVDTPFNGDGPHRRPPLLRLQAHALLSTNKSQIYLFSSFTFRQVIVRAWNLRCAANFIPPKSFRSRRVYFSNESFRSMLQNGIDLSTVDVSYVSSRSWY